MGSAQSNQSQQQQQQQSVKTTCTIVTNAYGAGALDEAEGIDHYRELCQTNKSNSLARFRQSYFFNAPSLADKDLLLERITAYQSHIPELLVKELSKAILVPLMPSADNGMPHTRPPHYICLPASQTPLDLNTYVHELWHLHQRAYYSKWKQFFKQWKFTVFEGTLPNHLATQVRINPDTLTDPLWLWKGEWIPICVFTDPVKPTFKETEVWFYNKNTGVHRKTPPPDMTAFFSSRLPPSAYEHPSELSAYLLTTDRMDSYPAYQVLESFFGKGIAIRN